jgi:hypothetical protein
LVAATVYMWRQVRSCCCSLSSLPKSCTAISDAQCCS